MVSYRALAPAGHAGRGVALSYRAFAPGGAGFRHRTCAGVPVVSTPCITHRSSAGIPPPRLRSLAAHVIPRRAASSGTSNKHLWVCEDADGSIPAAYLFARSPALPVYVTTNCQLLTTNCNRPLFYKIVRIFSAATSIRLNANIFLPKSLRDAPR